MQLDLAEVPSGTSRHQTDSFIHSCGVSFPHVLCISFLLFIAEVTQRDALAVLPASLMTPEVATNLEVPLYAKVGVSLSDQARPEKKIAEYGEEEKTKWHANNPGYLKDVYPDIVLTFCNIHHLSGFPPFQSLFFLFHY